MNRVRVVIVDSGVNTEHPEFIHDRLKGFTWNNSSQEEGFEDEFGHGTAIYGIIRTAKDTADILNIKLKDVQNGAEERELLTVLQYVDLCCEADLVNISVGLDYCDNYSELETVCKQLRDHGTVIIASFGNEGNFTYPAAFSTVIGVISDRECRKDNDFLYIEDDIVNLCARGSGQRLAWLEPQSVILSGNSFACAHAAAAAIGYLSRAVAPKKGPSRYSYILDCFRKEALSVGWWNFPEEERICPKINRAVLYPFNKEMHALIRFASLLSFEIVGIYDSKYSCRVGRDAGKIIGIQSSVDRRIKNINDIEWNLFDTIILGHMDELSMLTNQKQMKNQLIIEAVRKGKTVFSYDSIDNFIPDYRDDYGGKQHCILETEPASDKFYYPRVTKADLPPNRMGMLYKISKPVVGIFGTSASQGKYTLQISMGEAFRVKGYNVGQIGTEPNALLLGMDYVYPMGYNSGVSITETDAVRYLNNLIHNLCKRDKDIIIAASQSGTVPYDMSNCMQLTIPQITFLIGIQPDVVILCVNPYDSMEMIHRTIQFIESCIECKVIELVMYPFDLKYGWKSNQRIKRKLTYCEFSVQAEKIEREISLPVLSQEKDMDRIVEIVMNYF